LIGDGPGEARLADLRAEGQAMDEGHAVAYALEAIASALQARTSRLGRQVDRGATPGRS
jgi:hypothetical protein